MYQNPINVIRVVKTVIGNHNLDFHKQMSRSCSENSVSVL